jgi:hypothetical protein
MIAEFAQKLSQRRTLANDGIWYGKRPEITFLDDSNAFRLVGFAIGCAVIAWLVIFILEWIIQPNLNDHIAEGRASALAFIAFFAYLTLPYIKLVHSSIKNRQWVGFHSWQSLTRTQKTIANVALAFLIVYIIDKIYLFIATPFVSKPIDFNNIIVCMLWGLLSLILAISTAKL